MTLFESLKFRHKLGWVRIDQLKRYVQLQAITEEEYKKICGKDYVA
mgnify:FL=1